MTVSITELPERLDEILREVETNGTIVDIVRDGRVVAHIVPATQPDRPRPRHPATEARPAQAPAGKMPTPRLPLSDEGLGDPTIAERVNEILGHR